MVNAIKLSLYVVSAALMLLIAVFLGYFFEFPMEWLPFSFAAVLQALGVVCVLAALAEIFGGKVLAQWFIVRPLLAFFFGYLAYVLLTATRLPLEYPQDQTAQFFLAFLTVMLSLGALHLQYQPRK